jgi:tetratricopeptide (TPR) repeat protein
MEVIVAPISRSAAVLLGLLLLVRTSAVAEAVTAEQRFAEGQTLLAKGDVDAAATAFVEAARGAPNRADFVERATLLRRVQGLRRVAEKEQDGQAVDRAIAALHVFYLQNDLPRLAVEADRKAHARLPSTESAGRLAEALLANGENAEVTTVVAAWSGSSLRLATYHAIALARMGYKEDATRLLDKTSGAADPTPADHYDRARALALLGRADEALALLVGCIERTPPAALPALRARAPKERDFASLVALPAFAKALETESKVKETCSGGSTCAGCPNRGACGGPKR